MKMRVGQTIIKNTSVLFVGHVLSMVLGVVYAAALSRYIQPVGMGKIATANSLVSVISLVINFGLADLTIRDIARKKEHASAYVPALFFMKALLSFLSVIIVIIVSRLANYPTDTTTIIFIYCLVYITDGFTSVCISIFDAYEKMEYSASLLTGRNIINISLSLTAIALNAGIYIIVAISVLANVIKLIVSLTILRRKFTPSLEPLNLGLSQDLLMAALPFAALAFINIVTTQVDTLTLSFYWPADEVGWFSSAKLLISYLLVIPSVFLQAIFPVFSKFNLSSKENLRLSYKYSFKYLLVLGVALCFGILVTADHVIALVFGPGFEKAATALRILAWVLFWMFGYANGSLLLATGGQNIATMLSSVAMVISIVSSLILTPKWGLIGASITHILPGAIFFMPLIWICHKRLDLRIPYLLGLKTILAGSIMAATAGITLNRLQLPLLVVVLIIAPIVYGLALFVLRVINGEDLSLFTQLFEKRVSKTEEEVPVHTQT